MAITANHFLSAMLIMIMVSLDFTVAQIGVYNGRNGNNLPSPTQVVALYKQYNIKRMRIYEPHQPTLQALSGSNIEVTMSVPNNNDLQYVAASQDNANVWVRNNVLNYPNVRFRHIVVGNEIDRSQYAQIVRPAMEHVYTALSSAGRANTIKVTTSVSLGVLGKSYPPADGEFRPDIAGTLKPIVQFLVTTGAPLYASIYPYLTYLQNPGKIPLNYALCQPNSGQRMPDGTYYDNLYYALVDAVYAAIEKSAAGLIMSDANVQSMEVVGGESGASSSGSHPTSEENLGNERTYITNLIRIVKTGTPKRPGRPIETYIFTMFDENLKENDYERNFGIFYPDGRPKFPINFN